MCMRGCWSNRSQQSMHHWVCSSCFTEASHNLLTSDQAVQLSLFCGTCRPSKAEALQHWVSYMMTSLLQQQCQLAARNSGNRSASVLRLQQGLLSSAVQPTLHCPAQIILVDLWQHGNCCLAILLCQQLAESFSLSLSNVAVSSSLLQCKLSI